MTELPVNDVRKWAKGEAITAKRLNEHVDATNRLAGGVTPPAQKVRPANATTVRAAASKVVQFVVVSEEAEYLICAPFDGVKVSNESVKVAKPWHLRASTYDGKSIGTTSYTSLFSETGDYTKRKASGGAGTWTETIEPAYVKQAVFAPLDTNSVIYAARNIEGAGDDVLRDGAYNPTQYLDLNVNGRNWVRYVDDTKYRLPADAFHVKGIGSDAGDLKFDLSLVTDGATRTITMPDNDVTLGGVSTLGGLSDVTLSSPADKEFLYYNNADGEWQNTGFGTWTYDSGNDLLYWDDTDIGIAQSNFILFDTTCGMRWIQSGTYPDTAVWTQIVEDGTGKVVFKSDATTQLTWDPTGELFTYAINIDAPTVIADKVETQHAETELLAVTDVVGSTARLSVTAATSTRVDFDFIGNASWEITWTIGVGTSTINYLFNGYGGEIHKMKWDESLTTGKKAQVGWFGTTPASQHTYSYLDATTSHSTANFADVNAALNALAERINSIKDGLGSYGLMQLP